MGDQSAQSHLALTREQFGASEQREDLMVALLHHVNLVIRQTRVKY